MTKQGEIGRLIRDLDDGMSRREFVVRMTALGVSAAAINSLLPGNPLSTGEAEAATPASAAESKTLGVVDICATCTGEARMVQSFRKETETLGWNMTLVDAGGDFNKAVAAFENLIQSRVDAIVDAVVDPLALSDVIAKANAAGIPFVIESSDWVPGAVLQVGMNSYQMGTSQGLWITDRAGHEGNVIIFTVPAARNVEQREAVFRAIISTYPQMKIIETHAVDLTRAVDDARQTMETYLLRYPKKGDITAIWCAWDDPAMGAAIAIDSAGRDEIFLIGNDAGDDALEYIRGGSAFDGTVLVDYETIGSTIVRQLQKIFETGKPDATNIYVDQPIISPHNNNVPPVGQRPASVQTYSPWPGILPKSLSG